MPVENEQFDLVLEEVKRGVTGYESNKPIRMAIQALPYVGGPIDVLLAGKGTEKWTRNLASLLQDLHARMKLATEDKIDHSYLESDQFQTLLIRVLQSLNTTHQREKVTYFANILTNSVVQSDSSHDEKERFIMLVEGLTGLHLRIVKFLADKQEQLDNAHTNQTVAFISSKEVGEMLHLDVDTAEGFCADLLSRGLLYDPIIGTKDYSRGSYSLHPSARRFAQFILG